jgi:lipoyl(octanoyl) transferase
MLSNPHLIDFGLAPYQAIYQQQLALLAQRIAGTIPDTVLIGEHTPVYTVGRGYKDPLPPFINDTPVIPIERGGQLTWHGPGQLVVYPIMALAPQHRDLHQVLRWLEAVVIEALATCGVEGYRQAGLSGVWVSHPSTGQALKIASVGVAVKRWVTYHGVALNVSNTMAGFEAISPCGLPAHLSTRLLDSGTLLDTTVTPTAIVANMKQALITALYSHY